MPRTDRRTFRTREFAELAGITPRALRHYDRLGLLKPQRTDAGYRAYSTRDLARLEQIIALKFIGVPLRRIGQFTARTPDALANALRAQRQVLEKKRHLLDQAISAIGEAEQLLRAGGNTDPSVYRRIIEVIEMQTNNEEWKKAYETLMQAKIDRLRALSPETLTELRAEWAALVQEVSGAVGDDPAGPRAKELAGRWIAALEKMMGGPLDRSMLGAAAAYEESASSTATMPGMDRRVWEFMNKAISVRK